MILSPYVAITVWGLTEPTVKNESGLEVRVEKQDFMDLGSLRDFVEKVK